MGQFKTAIRQIAALAGKEIEAGFRARGYRIFALICVAVIFAIPLFPRIADSLSPEKKVAVVGNSEDVNLFFETEFLPGDVKYDRLEQAPDDKEGYALVIGVSASPITLKTEKLSQVSQFQELLPVAQLYQERKQLRNGEISLPRQHVEFSYAKDDSEEALRTALSLAISLILFISLGAFASGVGQGIFADKNNRIVDVLYPKTSAWRLLAGKVIGMGIFGWLQLLIFGLIATIPLTFFVDLDWQKLLLPPYSVAMLWFIFGYLFMALIVAALASAVRNAESLNVVLIPVYVLNFLVYVSGMAAVDDVSAPWVRWLGLFPPFSTTLVPIQAGAGLLDPVYATINILVALLVISACAWGGSLIYRGCVFRRATRA